jgi:hypothetical protein
MDSTTAWLNGIGLERVHYFPRQLITAEDMIAEQEYFRQKLRRHNRFLHGWGVVCGLKVTAAPTAEMPWRVKIGDGYALGPYGDEIYVANFVCFDLAKCGLATVPDPCEPCGPPSQAPSPITTLFVAIRYVECETRPVRVHPLGCACDEAACEYSRIRDDFKIACLTELPVSHQPQPARLCDLLSQQEILPCLPCPEEPWLVLAQVTLPSASTVNIANKDIDNFGVRRQLYSTATLQAQLIDWCCEPSESPLPSVQPARVERTDPEHNETKILPSDHVAGIRIAFTKPTDPQTVRPETFKVIRDNETPLSGMLTHSDDGTMYFFEPEGNWLPMPGKSSQYTITLIGTGSDPIKDKDGLVLDGDPSHPLPSGDGQPGGDFTSSFAIRNTV